MRLIDADALRKNMKFVCMGVMAGTENFNAPLCEIDNAPTVTPEPHWIPVMERLPDEDQPVLVTDGAVMWVCSLIRTDDGYKWENNMGYWHDFDEWKAWMPLPEPYKG